MASDNSILLSSDPPAETLAFRPGRKPVPREAGAPTRHPTFTLRPSVSDLGLLVAMKAHSCLRFAGRVVGRSPGTSRDGVSARATCADIRLGDKRDDP